MTSSVIFRSNNFFSVDIVHISHIKVLSRPLLKIAMWRYWFLISCYVYGGNRSFAPILRQSRWSLLYDVYWLVLMMVTDGLEQVQSGTWTGSRIEIPEHGSGSELLFFFWTMNKQRIDESENNKINNRTRHKINERLITNKRAQINKKRITSNWHEHVCTIYISRVSLLIRLKYDRPGVAQS
jgi:hypothetical protein